VQDRQLRNKFDQNATSRAAQHYIGRDRRPRSVRLREDHNADTRACRRHRGPRDRAIDGDLWNEQGPSSDMMLAGQRQGRFNNARAASLRSFLSKAPAKTLNRRRQTPELCRDAPLAVHRPSACSEVKARRNISAAKAASRLAVVPALRAALARLACQAGVARNRFAVTHWPREHLID
jgi:hypothetical protein